jgi:hypothetical protein
MNILDAAKRAEALAMVLAGAGTVDEVAEFYDTEQAQFMADIYPDPPDDSHAGASCTCRECTPEEKR